MVILPAIDLLDGKCVRLLHGDYCQATEYSDDPVAVARGFAEEGAEWLHVVDLEGARTGRPAHLSVLAELAQTGLNLEVGGGIRTLETARQVLGAGAHRVVMGTALTRDLDFASEAFSELGSRLVAGIDARDGRAAVDGWTEDSGVDALALAHELARRGARRFIVTDIATDGALTGPNVAFLAGFVQTLAVPIIASGGISTLDDLDALRDLPGPGVEGVIIGRAIYEGRFRLSEALTQ